MGARNLPPRRLLLTVALVALAAAACGSSSKSAGPSTTPTSTASNSTLPPTSSGQSAATTPTKSFSGSSSSSFCDLARKDKAYFSNSKNVASKTPPELKALYGKLVPALEQAAAAAPSEIKGDFDTYVTEVKKIDAAFAAAQYNLENLDPTTLQKLNTPQIEAAFANIDQYTSQVCHITTPTTLTTPTT
jgi:hypothetical protein